MKFFKKKEFSKHIYSTFQLEYGFINEQVADVIDSETELYIFIYGPPFQRPGTETEFGGKAGPYVLLQNHLSMKEREAVKSITKYYGSQPIKIIGTNILADGIEVLALMPEIPNKFWWQNESS